VDAAYRSEEEAQREQVALHGLRERQDSGGAGADPAAALLPGLSPRDARILELWNQGRTASQIAETLGFSCKTIANRIGALRQRYGADRVLGRGSRHTG
jgi:DNA-binding CsgD family transcriptional regulator